MSQLPTCLLPTCLLIVTAEVDEEVEAAWNTWYDTVHLPDALACPGVLSGRRYTTDGIVSRTNRGIADRTRQRLYWQRQRAAFMPYASVEGLYARQRATFRLGLLRQLSPQLQMAMGYELRHYPNGSLGHILTTNFQLEKKREN